MSASTVITTGFGSFGDVNLIPTLGFGGVAAVEELRGRFIRRGRTPIWPDWEQQKRTILEEIRIAREMEAARAQRDALVSELNAARQITPVLDERERIARLILDIRRRAKAEIRRLERELYIARQRRLEMSCRMKKIRDDEEEEDLLTIAFIAGELYD